LVGFVYNFERVIHRHCVWWECNH